MANGMHPSNMVTALKATIERSDLLVDRVCTATAEADTTNWTNPGDDASERLLLLEESVVFALLAIREEIRAMRLSQQIIATGGKV
jgi:hypothetical protein